MPKGTSSKPVLHRPVETADFRETVPVTDGIDSQHELPPILSHGHGNLILSLRERQMKRFQSPERAQRFLSIFESINATFRTAVISSQQLVADDMLSDRLEKTVGRDRK